VNSVPVLQIEKLSKSFPGVKALADIDFLLRKGEIHGLMGENGAGKSTLIKVITGIHKRDAGRIIFEGEIFEAHSPMEATKSGISTVYQEINLIPKLSVAENIFLGRQPIRRGIINWKRINTGAESALKKLDIHLDVTRSLSSFSIAIQQMVSIARALDISAKVLILDEATSSLDAAEVKRLFSLMRKLKDKGLSIIFITHFINQVYEISDHITILRNGGLVGEYETSSLPQVELITRMLGKELVEFQFKFAKELKTEKEVQKKVFLQARGLEKKGSISAFDLNMCQGEVLGLAGLLGSGRTEIARLLFGVDKPDKGNTWLDGKKISILSPKKAIENNFGFCPENRISEGIIPELTVMENIILALQAKNGVFKSLSKKRQQEIADHYIKALNIVTPSVDQLTKNLSGGNQQKVIVARWLASTPRFLILDEPTRGIDVGTKAEIQQLILSLSQKGMAILFISSELEEMVRCCQRIVVLRDRHKIAELTGEMINQETVMHTIAEG
jgi:simple sugar transport system ATP-binding protein